MQTYIAALPGGWTQRDAEYVARQAGVTFSGVNVTAGTVTLLCAAEQVAANVAAWQAAMAGSPPTTPARIAEQIEAQLAAAMAAMQQIIDTADIPAGTLTAAQLSNHVRALQAAVKLEARLLRRIVRQVRGDLTGSD